MVKDSKKNNWQTKKLSEVCDFSRGLTYSKKDEVDFSDNIVLRSNNIDLKSSLLDLSDLRYINNKIIIPDNKRVRRGSIIICTANGSKSHLGKIALIDDDYEYAFGGFMGQLTPKECIDSKYFFYNLNSSFYKDHLEKISSGANINNLKFSDLKDLEIPLPPLSEQHHIVKILDEVFVDVAKAKENAGKNLQNAKELFESYLQSVFANPGKDWEEKKIKEIGKTQTGLTPKTANKKYYGNFVPFITPADVDILGDGSIRYNSKGLSEEGLEVGRKIEKNSVLMVCIGATIGKVGFATEIVSCNQQINTLTPEIKYDAKLFYYILSTKSFFNKVIEGSSQATLPIINKGKWENLIVTFPKSLIEQKSIVAKLDALLVETKKLETIYKQKMADLEELKKSVLKRAFNGDL